MTTKESSKELKELSIVLAEVTARLAKVIPELVEHGIVDYHLTSATTALSSLSRYARYLADISKMLDAVQHDSSAERQ